MINSILGFDLGGTLLTGVPIFVAGDGENDRLLMQLVRMSFAPTDFLEEVTERTSMILKTNKNGLLATTLHHALQLSIAVSRN